MLDSGLHGLISECGVKHEIAQCDIVAEMIKPCNSKFGDFFHLCCDTRFYHLSNDLLQYKTLSLLQTHAHAYMEDEEQA